MIHLQVETLRLFSLTRALFLRLALELLESLLHKRNGPVRLNTIIFVD